MIDKETIRKLTLAPLGVSKINDENGINISSSGNLSLGASGGISLSGGSVSISGSNKVLVQKSKSSYISLEGECYNQSNAVYENGSCRETYEPFTDDDPQNGVAEALAELEYKNELLSLSILGSNVMLNVVMQNDKINDINKSENNNSTIDKSGNSGSDGKSTLKSAFYAIGGGISKFSTFARDASLEFGEKVLGLNYDQCAVDSKSNKKLRDMYAEDDRRDAEDYDKLREKAPNKDVFDNVSKVISGGLILTDIVLAGHGLINIAKSGVSLAKLSGKAQNILKFGDKIANKTKNTVNKIGELNKLKNTKGVSNLKNINIEEVTPPGAKNPVKVYTNGNAQVNKGKIDAYIRGKIKKPENYSELKDRIEELTKLKDTRPSEFTKEMKNELKDINKKVHNYELSKGMGDLLNKAGIADTVENNEMIANTVLDAAKEVKAGNTKIVRYIKGTNKDVIVESWWIIDSDGTPYCSTIILKEVK
ncbi:hypothetical protein FDA48_01285 [Clostridium botulinum]|nr:hypothetical protein [Clostridium botulinum]